MLKDWQKLAEVQDVWQPLNLYSMKRLGKLENINLLTQYLYSIHIFFYRIVLELSDILHIRRSTFD